MASMRAARLDRLVLSLVAILFLPGCGSDPARRIPYETLQNIGQEDCRKNPSAECPKRESYDDYQRKRKELESK